MIRIRSYILAISCFIKIANKYNKNDVYSQYSNDSSNDK